MYTEAVSNPAAEIAIAITEAITTEVKSANINSIDSLIVCIKKSIP